MTLPPGPSTQAWFDPRICLIIIAALGSFLWHTPFIFLLGYLFGLCWFAYKISLWSFFAAGTFRRTVYFCLFWACMKLCFDGYTLVIGGELRQGLPLWPLVQSVLGQSMLLLLRLFLLMNLALCLMRLCSARAMGLGLAWFLRPICRSAGWKVALAITLMIRFLPLVHQHLAGARAVARARGLQLSGWAFWHWAFPHVLRLLFTSAHDQAVAVVARHLYEEEAWGQLPACSLGQVVGGALICILAAGCMYMPLPTWAILG